LKAGTKKTDEIHEYFIKLENIMFEVINDESDELRIQLEQMKNDMYALGAEYAAMSGSGSTMFGLFKQKVDPPEGWADFPTWSGIIP
jgi:4-diphosphocytidyl-2C-methyl-D-erythritol kinase